MTYKTTNYHNLQKPKQNQLLVFASDGTGIASETLGLTIMSQFGDYETSQCETLPFINKIEDALEYANTINTWCEDFIEVIVFSTFADKDIQKIFTHNLKVPYFDMFDMLLPKISQALNKEIIPSVGVRHKEKKAERAAAIDYALAFDDGQKMDFSGADIILLGLSRSGKTPTALWLALHYGLHAANYPITPDDFDRNKLPESLVKNLDKCVLLLPNAERLSQIRQERYKDSKYASLVNCQAELNMLHNLPNIRKLPIVDVSNKSVEEIAANALLLTNIHPKGRF
jgi:regulator of PEP synthase PpsR (kinase-PPPase family)